MVTVDHQALVLDTALARLLELDDQRPMVVSTDSASTFNLAGSRYLSRCELVETGVKEASAVAFALGAASAGVPVLVATFASFGLRRGYESLAIHADSALRSPLVMLGGLPGLAAARDGVSHHALDDFTLARALPGVRASVPCCSASVVSAVGYAARHGGVAYLRTYRGYSVSDACKCRSMNYVVHQPGDGVRAVIGYGPVLWEIRRLAPTALGVIEVSGVHAPSAGLIQEIQRRERVVVVDEHGRDGGLGAALECVTRDLRPTTLSIDRDPGSGSYQDLLTACGIDPASVIAIAMQTDGPTNLKDDRA